MHYEATKVAVIVGKFPSGGADRQGMIVAKNLSKRGFEVEVLALHNSSDLMTDKIRVVGLNMERIRHRLDIIALFKEAMFYRQLKKHLCGRFHVVIIFSQLYGTSFVGNDLVKVFSLRMFQPNSIKHSRSHFLKRFDLITCNSLPEYSLLCAKGYKALLLNNGVAFEKSAQDDMHKEVGSFLLVSNFFPRKNIETAVKAFALLNNEDIRLRIVGRIKDKQYFAKIMRLVESSENVQYVGCLEHEELDSIYRMSSALIHPSRREGTSNAILDAMRYRIPAIVSRIPENIALVENVRDFLFDPDSPEELAERVTILHSNLQADPHFYDEYLDLQEKKIKLVYSQDNIEDLVTAIEELVKRKNL